MLGSVSMDGFSTIRVAGDQLFGSGEGSDMGPLLREGASLELRWVTDVKKPKGRPGSAAAAGQEGGIVRFAVFGKEVGRLPSWAARMLLPLVNRNLIDVSAEIGLGPPRSIDIGTNIPVIVRVQLRSTALTLPGKAAPGKTKSNDGGGGKAKSKSQKAVFQEEQDGEVRKNATAALLERLSLNRRRSSQVEEEAGNDAAAEAVPAAPAQGAEVSDPEEDAEDAEEDMTREAAAQLGSSHALERLHLPGFAVPPNVFKSQLRPYQMQAVYWMWKTENPTADLPAKYLCDPNTGAPAAVANPQRPAENDGRNSEGEERELHPMWDEYELPFATGPLPGNRPSVSYIYHHRTSGALSLEFPDAALAHCRGGILADDMGLGKTVMCLALLSLDYGPPDLPSAKRAAPELRALEEADEGVSSPFQPTGTDDGVGGVLVVAPPSLIRQWHTEVERHFPAGRVPNVLEYHGSSRPRTPKELRNYGIVLTTYGTLSQEREDTPLFQVYWRRVILDEAHTIKNRCSRQAQAAFQLRSFCRWCVTGTPLQNSVEELYSLVRFLRVDPWSDWSVWRKAVVLPLEKSKTGDEVSMQQALDTARKIATPLLLRRTKATMDPKTGQPLLVLPPKHVHVLDLQLTQVERDFYEAVYTKAKTKFDSMLATGNVMTMYTHILQLITKLRQALCHPILVYAREQSAEPDLAALERRCMKEMGGSVSEKFIEGLLQDVKNGKLSDCPVCVETPEDPTLTPCGHIFCRECCYKFIRECKGFCPVCRRPDIDRKSLKVLPGASRFPKRLMASSDGQGLVPSTKMKELLNYLQEDMAAGRRSVVYSQWTSFLDLVGDMLQKSEIPFQRFDGSLNLEERHKRVMWLSEEAPPGKEGRVLMVSLKAGGCGLNLVAATRLYLLDLWWNPAVEEQAIQRVYRIGQTKEVHVYKFVVSDSIDVDLMGLHRAKERLLEDALRGGRSQAATKLTLDDLKRLFNPCRSSLRALRGAAEQPPAPAAALPPAPSSAPSIVPPVRVAPVAPVLEEDVVMEAPQPMPVNKEVKETQAPALCNGTRRPVGAALASAFALRLEERASQRGATGVLNQPAQPPQGSLEQQRPPQVQSLPKAASPQVMIQPAAAAATTRQPAAAASAPTGHWEQAVAQSAGSFKMEGQELTGFQDGDESDEDLSDSDLMAVAEVIEAQQQRQTQEDACWDAMPADSLEGL